MAEKLDLPWTVAAYSDHATLKDGAGRDLLTVGLINSPQVIEQLRLLQFIADLPSNNKALEAQAATREVKLRELAERINSRIDAHRQGIAAIEPGDVELIRNDLIRF